MSSSSVPPRSSPPVHEDSSTFLMSNMAVSSISTTAASGEEPHARLVGRCLPFDFLLVCATCSLESLSDCDSSLTDDGDRAHFPFDFKEALFLGSHEQGPLLGRSATAFCIGHCTQSNLRDICNGSVIFFLSNLRLDHVLSYRM